MRIRQTPVADGRAEAYREMMVDFFSTETAEHELCVQLCTDLGSMPIEDATVEWPESLSPYEPVATLTYKKQNPDTDKRRYFGDEVLSFNSWRGPERAPPARTDQPDEAAGLRSLQSVPPPEEPRAVVRTRHFRAPRVTPTGPDRSCP
jgi:hypothetical protein